MIVVCHFDSVIKISKSKRRKSKKLNPDDIRKIGHQARVTLEALRNLAAAGNEDAKDEFEWLLRNSLDELKTQLERKSKAGELSCRIQPIGTMLEICDFVIPLLLWLSKNQSENIKKYARNRWSWPTFIHLLKQEQTPYQNLLPKFNRPGTKIVSESPIELGRDLSLNLNAIRTKGDYLFRVSAHAVYSVAKFARDKDNIPHNLVWMRWHHKSLQKLYGDKFQLGAEKYHRLQRKLGCGHTRGA